MGKPAILDSILMMNTGSVNVIDRSEIEKVQQVLDKWTENRPALRVLEAGCGACTRLRVPHHSRITGIDTTQVQLDKNTHLHEKILGDIQTHEFPPSSFDLIISWDVLEHLSHPEKALKHFVKTLKPGGLLILALPNVFSFKGLVTKATPFWFHVWFYRVFLHDDTAGKDGNNPHPACLRFSISPGALQKFALREHLSIEYFKAYESEFQKDHLRKKYVLINVILSCMEKILKILSGGAFNSNLTDCLWVLKKSPHP